LQQRLFFCGTVEVGDDEAVALAQIGQLLLQHQGEERAEHMAADGGSR
jgi:hypothetical protein